MRGRNRRGLDRLFATVGRIWPPETAYTCREKRPLTAHGHSSGAVFTDGHTLAELIIGGALASTEIMGKAHEDQGATVDGDSGEAA